MMTLLKIYVLTNQLSNESWIASISLARTRIPAARKLILSAQLLILQLVMDHPAHYLDKIQRELLTSPAH